MSLENINRMLDNIIAIKELKNDAALSFFLEVHPPVISKIRTGKLPFGPAMILRVHEKSGMSVPSIRRALAN